MDEKTWTAIGALGQWFAGSCTLAAVVYVIYRDYWKGPDLILSFDKDTDIRDQTNTPGRPPSQISRWVRVRAQNKSGRRAAKNCRAHVIGIEKIVDATKTVPQFQNDVRRLRWTNYPPEEAARDLLPGVVHHIDLLSFVTGAPDLYVECDPSIAFQANSPGHGTYRFTVQVSGEDADAKEIAVVIRWDGASVSALA